LAAWELVCRPKVQGGLGIINLAEQNKCLLMKHLHNFLNHANLPWVHLAWEAYYSTALPSANTREVSFWWRDCLKCVHAFCSMLDIWRQTLLATHFPHLFSFSKDTEISVAATLELDPLHNHFHLPLSVEAFTQLEELQ
jgi:hypothetical protein